MLIIEPSNYFVFSLSNEEQLAQRGIGEAEEFKGTFAHSLLKVTQGWMMCSKMFIYKNFLNLCLVPQNLGNTDSSMCYALQLEPAHYAIWPWHREGSLSAISSVERIAAFCPTQ